MLDQWEFECTEERKLINVYSLGKNKEAKAAFLFSDKQQGIDLRDSEQQKELINQVYSKMGWETPKLLMMMKESSDFYFDSITQINMNHWYKDRVVLVGDAGYCASPVSGQGTSLALIGAYVLAGELAKTYPDYKSAFIQYENELQQYVKLNQKLGRVFASNLTGDNKNKIVVWLHEQLMRFVPGKWTDYITKQSVDSVNKAANAIKIKNYN